MEIIQRVKFIHELASKLPLALDSGHQKRIEG